MKKHVKHLIALLIFIVGFTVYIITLQPDLGFIDAGELAASAATLGVCHPTGYPLWTLTAHLWTFLPLPFTVIYKLNLFAAFMTALSGAVFFYLSGKVIEIIRSKNPGKDPDSKIALITSAASAFAYLFARTVWAQGNSIEVYSFQAFMICIVLLFALKASTERNIKLLAVTGLLTGLAFSNHMTTILMIPALLFLFFRPIGGNFSFDKATFKKLLIVCGAGLVGLGLYLYLPLRSAQEPAMNWGEVHRGFDKFLYHVSGKQYQIWMFTGKEVASANLAKFFELLPYQFGFIGLIPVLAGFWSSFRSDKSLFWFLILLFLGCLFYSINYSISDIDSYFLTAFTALFACFAAGMYFIALKYGPLAYAAFAVGVISLIINFKENDLSEDNSVPEYITMMTEKMPEKSLIISSQWDYFCSGFMYKQIVENYRPGTILVEQELLRRTWYVNRLKYTAPALYSLCSEEINDFLSALEVFESGKQYDGNLIQLKYEKMLNSFIDKMSGQYAVYVTQEVVEHEPGIAKAYMKIPQGLAIRLEKSVNFPDIEPVTPVSDKFLKSVTKYDARLNKGIRTFASTAYAVTGSAAYRAAVLPGAEMSYAIAQADIAENAFREALKIDPLNMKIKQMLDGVLKMKSAGIRTTPDTSRNNAKAN